MKIRIFSIVLIAVLLVGMFPVNVSAAQTHESIITLDDGSYLQITIEDISARATNTRTANKYLTYYNSSDEVEWEAKLTASFTYTGTTSSCTSAGCSVTVNDSAWYVVSKSASYSGNTATANLTMGKKFLGITIDKPEYTITLTCDKDGNLS